MLFNAIKRTPILPALRYTQSFFHSQIKMKSYSSAVNSLTLMPRLNFIPKLFMDMGMNTSEQTMKIQLVSEIVATEISKAHRRHHEPKGVLRLIETIPAHLSSSDKLEWFCKRLQEFPAMPVITAHPTRIFSNEVLYKLYDIVDAAIKLSTQDLLDQESVILKQKIKDNIQAFVQHSMLPKQNLTPQEEAEMALFIYQKMLESFPDFYNEIVEKYVATHGGDTEFVAQRIKASVMMSFQNIFSWVKGDADGNHNVTADTMALAVPMQQIAIMTIYLKKLHNIIKQMKAACHEDAAFTLQKVHHRMQRCIKAIHAGIWFDVAGSEKEKNRVIKALNAVFSEISHLPHIQQQLNSLRDLIELAGFSGGMKEYVRQTTKVNGDVLDNLMDILSTYNETIRELLQDDSENTRAYHELDFSEKVALHELLSSNPDYFLTLKQHASRFTNDTVKELKRLLFILKHSDIFPSYICSDTEHKINFNEVLILLRFSAYMYDKLYIGDMRKYPVNMLPLCETPRDSDNYLSILKSMLDDPSIREKIVASGFVSDVAGPSDLGKSGGIFVYILMLLNQMGGEQVLEEYKKIYPELKNVKLRGLKGFGGDMKRRFGSARQQAHSTHQGWGAYDILGAPGAYNWFLHGVVGYPSENTFKVRELLHLKNNYPKAFAALRVIEKQAIDSFQVFIKQPSNGQLLKALTNLAIEKVLNISSRAGAKKATTDITKIRAIGLVNLYLLTGVNWDIFMSVAGLLDLSDDPYGRLPLLFEHSTAVKDIIYKIYFSIAVSDIPRAWRKLLGGESPSAEQVKLWSDEYHELSESGRLPHHVLAYIDTSALLILQRMVSFLPFTQQARASIYFIENKASTKPSHQMAIEIMDALGDDFKILADETRELLPNFHRLAECLDAHQKNPNPQTEENAALACRGIQLAEGPEFISGLISRLHQDAFDHPESELEEGFSMGRASM